jgi:ElaB/YqjD/DUF883 family membrane-anchored ribosome-binding protein
MSKKKTSPKQYEVVLRDVLSTGYERMEYFINKLNDLKKEDPDLAKDGSKEKMSRIDMALTVVNDLLHPAHTISYEMFKGYGPMIDQYVKLQNRAFELGVITECFCHECDDSGKKATSKQEEIRKRLETYESQNRTGTDS